MTRSDAVEGRVAAMSSAEASDTITRLQRALRGRESIAVPESIREPASRSPRSARCRRRSAPGSRERAAARRERARRRSRAVGLASPDPHRAHATRGADRGDCHRAFGVPLSDRRWARDTARPTIVGAPTGRIRAVPVARGHHWEHYCSEGTEARPEVTHRGGSTQARVVRRRGELPDRFGGVSRGADDGSQRVRRSPVANRS